MIMAALACGSSRPWGEARLVEGGAQRDIRTVRILVSRDAFTPSEVQVRVGERVRLQFVRMTGARCARELIVSLDGRHQIRRPLSVKVPLELVLELVRAGELGFSCGMRMLGGTIDVRP